MRVLLVYPDARNEAPGGGELGAVAEPIALEYVGAGAALDGHDVRLLDLRLHPEGLDEMLTRFRPDVVGVTGYSMHVLRNLEVCRRVKELAPACRTVAGGHHATLEPLDFHEPEVDLVVAGEGVRPFRRILTLLGQDRPVQEVPGVWARGDGWSGRSGGSFRFGGDQEPLDLDTVPPPDRSLTAGDRHRYSIDWMKPIGLIRTTAGCPFRCSFCSLWRITNGRYLERGIDAVVEELRSIPERFVFLVDDEAFVDSKRMWALGEAIRKADLGKSFFAYARVGSLLRDLDLMRFWHGIGLRRLFVGIESVVESELALANKGQKLQETVEALRAAREIGISLFSNFIVRPTYTKRDFEELIAFIESHDVEYPAFTVLTPIPGTVTAYDAVVERQPNGRPNWDLFDLQHAVTPTRMPSEEFAREYENLYRIFKPRHLSAGLEPGLPAPDRSEALRDGYTRLAIRVLGGNPSS